MIKSPVKLISRESGFNCYVLVAKCRQLTLKLTWLPNIIGILRGSKTSFHRDLFMLSFLPSPLIFIINMTMISIASCLLALPLIFLALIRLILPFKVVLDTVDALNQLVFRGFCVHNNLLMRITTKVKWDIQGVENVKVNGSCIIISNHLSWTDIVMICHIYRGRIPITKFFLKQSLIFIPIIGQACYAIGMPFLRRYTRAQILKNPKLKTKDLDSTRKACQSLLVYPSSLVNFVEGTRFTKAKARSCKSPYQNLMPPKAASLAVALGMIGKNIDCLLNTTILYPDHKGQGSIFYALLCGRLDRVIARVEVIDKEFIEQKLVGDYIGDKQFKRSFTNELRSIWQKKDEQIANLLGIEYNPQANSAPIFDTTLNTPAAAADAATAAAAATTDAVAPAEPAEAQAESEANEADSKVEAPAKSLKIEESLVSTSKEK